MWQPTVGELNQQILIQQPITERNNYGDQKIVDWATLATTWANMRAIPQGENMAQDQLVSVVKVKFTIRFRRNLTPKLRILHAGKVYNIESFADPSGARRFLEIQCSEVRSGGAAG